MKNSRNRVRCISTDGKEIIRFLPEHLVNKKGYLERVGFQVMSTPSAPEPKDEQPEDIQDPEDTEQAEGYEESEEQNDDYAQLLSKDLVPAEKAVEKIKKMETTADIVRFIAGENRQTVLEAAQKRIDQLT